MEPKVPPEAQPDAEATLPTLKPLKISCTTTDCDNDLHCFRATRKMRAANEAGRCRSCGADLIEWPRVHKRDLTDAGNTFSALQKEYIRHYFWHVQIDDKAMLHARRKGRAGLRAAAENRVRKSVGPSEPSFDGRQTPWKGNVLYCAQHATACCCRTCMAIWHGIPKGRELTEIEVKYLAELVNRYIDSRLPNLADKPEKIPRQVRRSAAKQAVASRA